MSEARVNFEYCDQLVDKFEKVIRHPIRSEKKDPIYYTGVDLGTACVVIAVLDENFEPVAGAYRWASVVRDGMVVDYVGALHLVREMKEELEEKLGVDELIYAAAAIPPGTENVDGGVVANVVRGAGFEVSNVLDEPTAANQVLKIRDGAVVDIGGGTTGISIFEDGEVVYIGDEPTGGTHFSLVLAGAYKMPFEDAEIYKRDEKNHREIFPVMGPVIDKCATIIRRQIEGRNVDSICLVGGTACLTGIEGAIEKRLGIPVYKPKNPMFVTPLGIALSCKQEILY